jgi:prophage antirepressor-like protein
MSALQTFDFETNAVRALMRDEVPWFVAADVCRALGLTNPTEALKALDEDERAKLNLGVVGKETNIISESGLYTLILRSRDAVKAGTVAHRFRKWVTAEVLPSIRLTGGYQMPEPELPGSEHERIWGNTVGKINAAARMLGVVKDLYGVEAARALYEREKGLPKIRKFSVVATEENPTTNPGGALRRLLRSAAGNGQTISHMLTLAMRDQVAARRLSEYGLLAQAGPAKSYVAIANEHRFLASVFAGTPWQKEWRCAFLLLDGAETARTKQSFGEVKTSAVYVPHVTILKFLNHAEAETLPP